MAAMAAPPPAEPPVPPGRRCLSLPAVEPVVFLATVSLGLQGPLATQYLWDRLGADHGYINRSNTESSGCGDENATADPLRQVGAPGGTGTPREPGGAGSPKGERGAVVEIKNSGGDTG